MLSLPRGCAKHCMFDSFRPGKTCNSAAGLPARIQILVLPSAISRLLHKLLGRVRLGFPPFELHVYFSMWSEAEALSEYGAVPE
jgi:hypothetical protein